MLSSCYIVQTSAELLHHTQTPVLSSCYIAQTSAELLHHTQTLQKICRLQQQCSISQGSDTVGNRLASSMGSCDSSEEAPSHNGSKDLSSQSEIQATKQSLEALTAQLETQQKELNQAMVHAAASLA